MELIPLPSELTADLPSAAPQPLDPSEAASSQSADAAASEPVAALPTSLAMPELGALAYILCPTADEYIAQCEEPAAAVLRQRLREARIPADVQEAMVHYPDMVNFVALVGGGVPDTPSLLPLWIRIARAMPRADLRVVDEHSSPLLERLLGDDDDVNLDTIELPMFLVFDEEWHYQGRWGPRPAAAEALLDEWLAQHPEYEALAELADADGNGAPDFDEAEIGSTPNDWAALHQLLILQMRIWYNSGLDADAATEILALLASLQDSPAEVQ